MREIKFRGKRIEDNKLVYGFYGERDGKAYILTVTVSQYCKPYFTEHEVYPESVGQYTGLRDKNGKEIYEGDIIEGGYHNPLSDAYVSKKYIVEYSNCHFVGRLIGHSPYGDQWLEFIDGEVIGNIYENPELLGR